MTWLTRIRMPVLKALRLQLNDMNFWHKFAWTCFPGEPHAKRDFLTRIDMFQDEFQIYLLSSRKPVRPACCDQAWWGCRPVAPSFLEHDVYRFALRANPTKKVTAFTNDGKPKKNSRKVALLGEDVQRAWLKHKGEQGGFALDSRMPLTISNVKCSRTFHRKTAMLSIGVDFQGVLRVTDHELFQRTFIQGLGSSRAFGFGMLLLQPIRI